MTPFDGLWSKVCADGQRYRPAATKKSQYFLNPIVILGRVEGEDST